MKQKYRKLKELREFAKSYKAPKNEKFKNNLLSSESGIASVTKGSCIRPDIFLDNDRNCDDCPYYKACQCALKRLSNEKKKRK